MVGNVVRLAYALGLTHYSSIVCAMMNREMLSIVMLFVL